VPAGRVYGRFPLFARISVLLWQLSAIFDLPEEALRYN
jgi:hypothetical protein